MGINSQNMENILKVLKVLCILPILGRNGEGGRAVDASSSNIFGEIKVEVERTHESNSHSIKKIYN